jgi:hypothetical protein
MIIIRAGSWATQQRRRPGAHGRGGPRVYLSMQHTCIFRLVARKETRPGAHIRQVAHRCAVGNL